jgi:hypothetical protein
MCKHIHAVVSKFFLTSFISRAHNNFKEYVTRHKGSNSEPKPQEKKNDPTCLRIENVEAKETKNVSSNELESLISSLSIIDHKCRKLENYSDISLSVVKCKELISYNQKGLKFASPEVRPDFNRTRIVVKQRDIGTIQEENSVYKFKKFKKKTGPKVKELVKTFSVCWTCFLTEDSNTSPLIDWVSCLRCHKWFHLDCLQGIIASKYDLFVCCIK